MPPCEALGRGKMINNIYEFEQVGSLLCIKATETTPAFSLGNCPKCFSGGILRHPCRYCQGSYYRHIHMFGGPVQPIHLADISAKPFDFPTTFKDLETLGKTDPPGMCKKKKFARHDLSMVEMIIKNKTKPGEYPTKHDEELRALSKLLRNKWFKESLVMEDAKSTHYGLKIVKHADPGRDHFALEYKCTRNRLEC